MNSCETKPRADFEGYIETAAEAKNATNEPNCRRIETPKRDERSHGALGRTVGSPLATTDNLD